MAAIPPFTIGRTSFRNAYSREYPLINATSSTSCGTLSKKPFIIQVAKPMLTKMYNRVRPNRVSASPSLENMIWNDTSTATAGSIRVDSTKNMKSPLPLKSKRLAA